MELALARDLRTLPESTRKSALAVVAVTAARHADACDEKMFPAIMAQLRAALGELGLLERAETGDWVDDIAARRRARRTRKSAG